MLELGDTLIKELNGAEIRWVIWKGCYHYLDGFEGIGDIDLLVHTEDKSRAVKLLTDIGFLHFRTQKFSKRENVEDWIGLDAATKKFMHLHLHFAMVIGRPYVWEFSFKPSEQCLKDSIENEDGIRVQNPCWEYILFLCRMRKEIISKKKIEANLDYFRTSVSYEEMQSILGEEKSDKVFKLLQSKQFERDIRSVDDVLNEFIQLDINNSSLRSTWRRVQAKITRKMATL